MDRFISKARKNILDYLNQETLLDYFKTDFDKAVQELQYLTNELTGDDLIISIGIKQPPENDPEFKQFANNLYFYNGDDFKSIGIWRKNEFWELYPIYSKAVMYLEDEKLKEKLLPENFTKDYNPLEKKKRPIFCLDDLGIYAKGPQISKLFYHKWYRKFSNPKIGKLMPSSEESKLNQKLAEAWVNVPENVGLYQGPIEEFYFVKEVKGVMPDKILSDKKEDFMKQDAEMLANIFKMGYTKQGFTDYDDKIYTPDNKLYLIDIDEVVPIFCKEEKLRKSFFDPSFKSKRNDYIHTELINAIMGYNDKDFLVSLDDKKQYIEHFYHALNMKATSNDFKEIIFLRER